MMGVVFIWLRFLTRMKRQPPALLPFKYGSIVSSQLRAGENSQVCRSKMLIYEWNKYTAYFQKAHLMHYLFSFNNFTGNNKRLLGVSYLLSHLRMPSLWHLFSSVIATSYKGIWGGEAKKQKPEERREQVIRWVAGSWRRVVTAEAALVGEHPPVGFPHASLPQLLTWAFCPRKNSFQEGSQVCSLGDLPTPKLS